MRARWDRFVVRYPNATRRVLVGAEFLFWLVIGGVPFRFAYVLYRDVFGPDTLVQVVSGILSLLLGSWLAIHSARNPESWACRATRRSRVRGSLP